MLPYLAFPARSKKELQRQGGVGRRAVEKIRRLVVRYDRSLKIYRAFSISVGFMIVSRRVLLSPFYQQSGIPRLKDLCRKGRSKGYWGLTENLRLVHPASRFKVTCGALWPDFLS
jgi:hypothetical protein